MKNFLEWYKDTDINVIQTGFMKCEHKPDLNKVADFYNTPFKPELITELFESEHNWAWVNKENNGGWHLEEDDFGNINSSDPVTLDHFISDCNRAGISLELKAEIKEKYGL